MSGRGSHEHNVRTKDGLSLLVRSTQPHVPRSCVVVVHGWGEHSGRYDELSEELLGRGHAVWTYDQRGHGRSDGIRGHAPRFSNLVEDLRAVTTYALQETRDPGRGTGGGIPLMVLGHSMGGLVTLRAVQLGAVSPDGLVFSAPWLAIGTKVPLWKRWLGEIMALSFDSTPIKNPIRPERVTRDPGKMREILQDPLVHGSMTPRLFKEIEAAQRRVFQDSSRLSPRVLFFLPGDDTVVDSAVTRSFISGLPEEGRELIEVPDGRHELFNDLDRRSRFEELGGFFNAVLNEQRTSPRGGQTKAKGVTQDMTDDVRGNDEVIGEDQPVADEGSQPPVTEGSEGPEAEAGLAADETPESDENGFGDSVLEGLQADLDAAREKHLRLAAEFDNFRKRTENDLRVRWDRAQAELVGRLLEPLDDLQRVAAWEPETTSVEAIVEGVDLVERKFLKALADLGMEVVDPTGERFDPNSMEAMMRVPTESEEEDEMVQQVFRKGYVLKGQLVRPAQVSVFKAD